MEPNQTRAAGARMTLITGTGGRPVDRQTADRYCRSIAAGRQLDTRPAGGRPRSER